MTVLIFFFVSYFFSYDVKKSIISVTSNAVGSDCLTLIMMLPILDETLRHLPHNILFDLLKHFTKGLEVFNHFFHL